MDMMELWGGFPSREMLKSRDRVKGSHCDPLSPPFPCGKPFGSLGSKGRVGGQEGKDKGKSPGDPCARGGDH